MVLPTNVHKHIQLSIFSKGIKIPGCRCGIFQRECIWINDFWLVSRHFSELCLIIQKFQFTKIADFNGITFFRMLVLGVLLGVLLSGFLDYPEVWLLMVTDLSGI